MKIGVIDTSFLIDWAKYSKRYLLSKVYDKIIMLSKILDEIKSEDTLIYIVSEMERQFFIYVDVTSQIENRAMEIINQSLKIKRVDLPEALCIAYAEKFGYDVLTENMGAIRFPSFVKRVKAIDVLVEMYSGCLINDLKEELENYMRETKHRYSDEEIWRVISTTRKRRSGQES
jgi:predicted nucleic acid-binding protein